MGSFVTSEPPGTSVRGKDRRRGTGEALGTLGVGQGVHGRCGLGNPFYRGSSLPPGKILAEKHHH